MTTTAAATNVAPTDDSEWWKSFHVPEMADVHLVRSDPEELAATLEFLTEHLNLSAGGRVYDQCCGIGSLTIALARRGLDAVGVDLCDFFIERAARDAEEAKADCQFHCADAFEFACAPPCDAVINWFSSFGYADRDEQNLVMLRRAWDSLRPGGRIALDLPNLPGLLRGFQRSLVQRGKSAGRDVVVLRESTLNLTRGMLEQTWTWFVEGESPVERRSELRMYLPHQIGDMLAAVGFGDTRFFGSAGGEPLSLDSPRLLITARRP